MNIIVQTPRLIVREFEPDDEKKYIGLYESEPVTKYVSKRTEAKSREKFAGALADYANGQRLSLWGVYTPQGDFMGVAMLKVSENDQTKFELGYVFDEPYWGRGLATELATTLVKYGFETINLPEICACVNEENIASQNVLLKAGFKRQGTVFWHDTNLPFFRIVKG